MKNCFIFFTLFLFIFGWKVYFFIDLIGMVSVALFCYFLIFHDKFSKFLPRYFFLLLAALAAVLFSSFLGGGGVYELVGRHVRAIVNFHGGVGMLLLYVRAYKNEATTRLLLHIYIAICLHAFLMSTMYFWPPLREAIYQMTDAASIVNDTYSFREGYRIPGLTYGLSQTSLVQMLGVFLLFAIFLLWEGGSRGKSLLLALSGVPLVFSIFISGRSGLLIGLILLPVFALLALGFRRALVLIVPAVVGFGFILLVVSAIPEGDQGRLAYTISHVSEVFELIKTGRSYTADIVLGQMYFVPESARGFALGYGDFDRSALGIVTDVGYVRYLFAVGLIGSFFVCFPYLVSLLIAGWVWWIGVKKDLRYPTVLGALTLVVFLSGILLHGKEVALYTRNQWSIQVLVLLLTALFLKQGGVGRGRKEGDSRGGGHENG